MKQHTLVRCPVCHGVSSAKMPVDACVVMYVCPQCNNVLRPRPGDCCVFCSYGDDRCPPEQVRIDES